MTAIITIGAIIAVIASAAFGVVKGECLMQQGVNSQQHIKARRYTAICTLVAVMLIVVLAIL